MSTEKNDDRRAFDYFLDENTKVVYYLGVPTSEQIKKADWHYSKVYNKALMDGVAVEAEMLDILRKRNIYGPEYEEKLQELQIGVATKIHEMEIENDDLLKGKLALEVKALRDDLYRWNQRLNGPLSNTCEKIAEDAKVEYLASAMVQKEDGTPVWKSYDDFIGDEENQRLGLKARFEVLLWLQGLEPDFLTNTPENEALRAISERQRKKNQMALKEAEEKDSLVAKEASKAKKSRKKASEAKG